LIQAAIQEMTRDWWDKRRSHFDLHVSQFVIKEASAGDPLAARLRLNAIGGLPVLDLNEHSQRLAESLMSFFALPAKAEADAAHIAIAAVHGMHFLLTWNCTHIANAEMAGAIQRVCAEQGYACPVICTPKELMGV